MQCPFSGFGDLAAWVSIGVSLIWNAINTYIAFWNNRVHLKLVPKAGQYRDLGYDAFNTYGDKDLLHLSPFDYAFCQVTGTPVWEIVNLSTFAVYIDKIGFCPNKSVTPDCDDLHYLLRPRLIAGPASLKSQFGEQISLPVKLESREPLILAAENIEIMQAAKTNKYRYMFVMTSCGNFSFVKADFLIKFFGIRQEIYEEPSFLA